MPRAPVRTGHGVTAECPSESVLRYRRLIEQVVDEAIWRGVIN
jgi:hypothetical protein